MKKLIVGLGLAFSGVLAAHAQNGLENITVEKYYVSDAADAAGSVGTLPDGSVTYRIYADMLPGYKFQALYGVSNHELRIASSTTFFNNEDRGAMTPTYTKTQAKGNSVMLDSWFSVGAGCSGNFGILKSEDDGVLTVINSNGMLQNADPSAGIPLTTQDGLIIVGTPEPVTFVGFTTELDVFDATSGVGGLFTTTNGSIASLNGSTGPTSNNRVLLGQFTTDGVFSYKLNIQIGTPTGGVEKYVAENPETGEIQIASLMGTLGAVNIKPTVSITSPADNAGFITGDVVTIDATAADSDGSVASVEFFVDGVSIAVDNTSPYSTPYTSTIGAHALTAKATDDLGGQTTSGGVNITVANNVAPSVSVSAPATAVVGDVVTINATAADTDGSVATVEFFVDGVSIGSDATAPFSFAWTAVLGSHSFTAKATDDRGAFTTSSAASISVANNIPPSVSITAPTSSDVYTAPAVVAIAANAADVDGTVTSVEFFVNGVSIGTDASAPYTFDWTSVIGSASVTAKAIDNKGAITTSVPVVLSIADPNALPYRVVTVVSTCLPSGFCLPLAAIDTVKEVIGYDVVMQYNSDKITPTGVITMNSALINPTYVDIVNSVDAANGLINISVFLNGLAPANTNFSGVGNLFCVEFTKTVNFTSVDTALVSVSTLQESYFSGVANKLVEAGKYITFKDSTFHGALRFWSNHSPIQYNAANPNDYLITNIYGNNNAGTAQSLVAVQPDLAGNFVYNILDGEAVNIEKDILGTTDVQPVVNGADALLTRRVLLNDITLSPSIYQVIAMDVNADGFISAGDVSQINQRAVLMIPEFKQKWNYNNAGVSNGEASKDWLFIDSLRISNDLAYRISTTYPSNDGVGFSKSRVPVVPFSLTVPVADGGVCPLITNETYKGVLLGDVNGNFATVVPSSMFKTESSEKVIFDMAHAVVNDGYIDVPVAVASDKNVTALDFSMLFNESTLSFNSVVDHSAKLQALSNFNTDDRTLRFTSNSIEKYDVSKSQLSVRFAMNGTMVSNADLHTMKAYINGEPVAVELTEKTTGILESSNDQAVKVYPNPASNSLSIVLTEDATVQLFDLNGKQVVIDTTVNANQTQELNVQHVANGVYTLRIFNDTSVSIRKVVINK